MSDFDATAQPFKQWLEHRLRRDQRDDIDRLAVKLSVEKRIPRSGSKAAYIAYMRLYQYSEQDNAVFEQAWQEMQASQA